MLRGYHILTVTHKNTDLRSMDNFIAVVDGVSLQDVLGQAKNKFAFQGFMYLATCNRVLYLIYDESPHFQDKISDFLSFVNPALKRVELRQQVQYFGGEKAIEHLFEVAGSIDSLVIGEREILRQLREAYYQSKSFGLTNDYIRLLYKQATVAAKAIHSKTRIGEKPVSVVSLAMRQLSNCTLDEHAKILLIGAGQTNVLVAKFLKKAGYKNVLVFNRTFEKAQTLATSLQGEAVPFEAIYSYDQGFDCAIICTGRTEAWVTETLLTQWQPTANAVVIDLAIPNNVALHAASNIGVHYIQIEDLRALAEKNMIFREAEVKIARKLLADELLAFKDLFRVRVIANTLSIVPKEVKDVKERALNQVFKKQIDQLDPQAQQLILDMMNYMEKKCAGLPIIAAKSTPIRV